MRHDLRAAATGLVLAGVAAAAGIAAFVLDDSGLGLTAGVAGVVAAALATAAQVRVRPERRDKR